MCPQLHLFQTNNKIIVRNEKNYFGRFVEQVQLKAEMCELVESFEEVLIVSFPI